MPMDKPECEATGVGDTSLFDDKSVLGALIAMLTAVGAIYTVGSLILGGSMTLGAILGGGLVFLTTFAFYYMHCSKKREGPTVCTSGIINRIVPSFNSGWDYVFPFASMHTRVDLVVNKFYWPEVSDGAGYIYCAEGSPLIRSFYKDKSVCAAKLGSTVGALIGAVIGIALMSSLACGWAAWLCALIALIVVAVLALVGALVGGNIGKTQAEGRALPPGPDMIDPLLVGDQVALTGTLVVHPDFKNARVYWFVDITKQMGQSINEPPFSWEEASMVPMCASDVIVL